MNTPYFDDNFDNDDDNDNWPDCPACGNVSGFMGWLGNLGWFRCLFCGIEFSIPYSPLTGFVNKD